MKLQMLAVVLSHVLLLPALAQTHTDLPVPTPLSKPMTSDQTVDLLTQEGLTEIQPLGGNLAEARDRTGQQVRVTIDPRTRAITRTQATGR